LLSYRYKTTAAGKNLEQVLQKAVRHALFSSPSINETLFLKDKRNELPTAKRIQPFNLSVTTMMEVDNGTVSSSP
jgi:hypothetical protein